MGVVYDVGQHIWTPRGTAIVLAPPNQWGVRTDRGIFPHEETAEFLDVAAITESPEALEAWLEAPPVNGATERVVGESRPCGCPCGRRGNCHRLVHVDVVAEIDVAVFPHSAITGECRCVLKDCACTH